MATDHESSSRQRRSRTNLLLAGLTVSFFALAAALASNLWGRPPTKPALPLGAPAFLETTPWRQTYADLKRAKEDLSDYDCNPCHEKNKPPPIRFDANQKIIVPKEHENIAMLHGSHDRNNLCYNCHA